jgi:quinoprotein glucose dehydrogenase
MRTRLLLPIASTALVGWLGWQAVSAAGGPNLLTWDGYLGGGDSLQYSALKQINKNNVKQLQVAWMYPSGMGTYEFNPIVVDGVMYVLAKGNAIVALNAATGQEIWTHPNQGNVANRGLSYWESANRRDRRLLYAAGGYLNAIDARTGETVQSFGDNGRTDLKIGLDRDNVDQMGAMQTNNPGRVFENTIIMSLPARGTGDNYSATPADIHAYDTVTGKLKWIFHSIPRPGEYGYNSWPPEAYKWAGGVHNWSEMSLDEQRGIVYIPFGTARYDFYGGNRPGNNLFANSLVALDARTGKRLWHFQTVHHDLWDYDLATAPKLLTVTHNGKKVDIVAQPSKQGFLYVFDRVTGEPLWPIEERPVPKSDVPGEQASPTQPFPTAPPPFSRQRFTEADINPYLPEAEREAFRQVFRTYRNEGLFTPPSFQGTISMPGHNGGANWGGAAGDPERGFLYVMSKDMPTLDQLVDPAAAAAGRGGPGAAKGDGKSKGDAKGKAPAAKGKAAPLGPLAPGDFTRYNSPVRFMTGSNGLAQIGPPWSQITAYDLNTGTIRWQIPNGEVSELAAQGVTGTGAHFPRGGIALTAGGLLFAATSSDKKLRAYDADTGAMLWEYQFANAPEGVPAVYEVDGREFIVVAAARNNGMMAAKMNDGKQGTFGEGGYVAFALPRR